MSPGVSVIEKAFDRFFPPSTDPTLSDEERRSKQAERRGRVFAFALILGFMLALPILGGLYVLLIQMGVIPPPY